MSMNKTILDWALHWEKEAPGMLHFVQPMGGGADELKTWTFAQAVQESRRMATYLQRLGLPPKTRIAICSKNCAYWIMADWAIWMAGHVAVPIYPVLNAATTGYILEHSESKVLFVGKLDAIWADMEKGVPGDVKRIAFPLSPSGDHEQWDEIVARHEPLAQVSPRTLAEMATIVYTSGSTGQPKGVMLSFGAMAEPTERLVELLEMNSTDRMLSYLPLAHTMERWISACASTRAPFQLFFADRTDTFLQDLQRARPTLFLGVPRLWLKFQAGVFSKLRPKKLEVLLRIPIVRGVIKKKILRGLGLDQVRFAGSGSAPIPAELMSWYRKLGLDLLEGYGMTENFNYSHITKPGQVRVGYVGTPHPGVECKVSAEGEVLVKSPGLMMGYFKHPNETRDAFDADGFFKTGDTGSLDELGRLQITGRLKENFKTSKGKYVAPVPIENKLLNYPVIDQVCVSGAGQPQPYALVVLSEEARAGVRQGNRQKLQSELAEHLEQLNKGLDRTEQLQFLSVVGDEWTAENGFLTPTLKLKRAKIEDAYKNEVTGWYAQNQKIIWADSASSR
jgi:long-chain acyl-CoA synthetase